MNEHIAKYEKELEHARDKRIAFLFKLLCAFIALSFVLFFILPTPSDAGNWAVALISIFLSFFGCAAALFGRFIIMAFINGEF